ncbi:site-specific integrase [Methylobacterium sp. J-078]|uniref:tyrosine-type recombinase/integrase n=1 Tax=Methylobacterium sp. J-078 TaxID=2836657 RepID=UPI001FB9BB78|nr:site-specific integrase [Methylobacterium sp. J-078]MCJ2043062.1 site-specific integrase [Methylobacterium sp. J-078]
MAAKVLTVQSVERYKPDPEKRLEIPDATLPGFYLVVQPSGAKSWAVRYRVNGRPRKYTIGPYPLFDLSKARSVAREALQSAALGRDPYLAKREAAAASVAAEEDRVSRVIALYVERHLKPNGKPRYAEEAEALLRNHVEPRWGSRRIGEVTRKDVVAMNDSLTDSGMTAGANRVFSAARAMFNFALSREIIETTPFLGLKPPVSETSRDRVLTDVEVRLVWRAAEAVGPPFGAMVQLLLLTGQRRDEVARMVRGEVDGDLWTIPAPRTKNSLEHLVPLSAAAAELLAALPRIAGRPGYIFTRTGTAPISDYSSSKAKLDAAMLAIAREDASRAGRDPKGVLIKPWRLHDLRRTCSTGMAKLGQPIHVVEAVLNHRSGTISGVAAVYNRYQYLAEKRLALEAWAEHVSSLISEGSRHG